MSVTTEILGKDDQLGAELSAFLQRTVPSEWRSFSPADAAQCARALTASQALAVVARKDGVLVGLAFGWVLPSLIEAGDAVMLDELVVDPDHRGRSIGTLLVNAFVASASERASAPCHIWATTDAEERSAAGPCLRAGAREGGTYRQFDWILEAQV